MIFPFFVKRFYKKTMPRWKST